MAHAITPAERPGTAASGSAIGAGIVAGLIGGIAMGMVAMIRAAIVGTGFFTPMQLIAATFYGPDALQAGASSIIVGMCGHLFNSALFGLIFGLVVGRRWSITGALTLGLAWGVVIWLIMTWIVLPAVDNTMRQAVEDMSVWWFIYHLVFGAGLLFTPPLAATFSGRPTTNGHESEEFERP